MSTTGRPFAFQPPLAHVPVELDEGIAWVTLRCVRDVGRGLPNTRYYAARVEQALATLARRLELKEVGDGAGGHRLLVKAQHMRFLREARAGAALHVTGQVVSWGRDDAAVLFLLHHWSSGQVAATFRLSIACTTSQIRVRRSGH